MNFDDFKLIYEEMHRVFSRDKELTHIEINFYIRPIITEKKIAKINVKTFRDDKQKRMQ
jgi:hypothetical protein